jgi:hypothetical protein
MKNHNRTDLNREAIRRLLGDEHSSAVLNLILQAAEIMFDSVGGAGSWRSEVTDGERRTICESIVVRMVGELFKPDEPPRGGSCKLH